MRPLSFPESFPESVPKSRRALRSLAAAVMTLIGLSVSGCGQDPAPSPSLVLITIDHLIADHLACFGGPPENGKSLCRLAEGGTLMAWAISPGTGLASSLASVHTGTPEAVHGMDDRGLSFLADAQTTIAEVLLARKYRTAAFVTTPALNQSRRLDQGFERYTSFPDGGTELQRAVEAFVQQPGDPYFVWIHLTQPKGATPREGLAEIDRTVAGLAGLLRGGDGAAILLTALRGLPAEVKGIGLASHRVPMIWRPPNGPRAQSLPRVRFGAASLMDIAPTLTATVAPEAARALHARLEPTQTKGMRIDEVAPLAQDDDLSQSALNRFLVLVDGAPRAPAPSDRAESKEEVGLVSGAVFYVRTRGELDGTGQPAKSPELTALGARFVAASPLNPERARLAFTPWREDVLAKDSPVPRLEFHLARELQEHSFRQ